MNAQAQHAGAFVPGGARGHERAGDRGAAPGTAYAEETRTGKQSGGGSGGEAPTPPAGAEPATLNPKPSPPAGPRSARRRRRVDPAAAAVTGPRRLKRKVKHSPGRPVEETNGYVREGLNSFKLLFTSYVNEERRARTRRRRDTPHPYGSSRAFPPVPPAFPPHHRPRAPYAVRHGGGRPARSTSRPPAESARVGSPPGTRGWSSRRARRGRKTASSRGAPSRRSPELFRSELRAHASRRRRDRAALRVLAEDGEF